MVNVRAARRYGIYPRSFSIPDEGGARVWYVKTNRTMQREAASRACGKRGVLCTVYVSSPLHWPTGL